MASQAAIPQLQYRPEQQARRRSRLFRLPLPLIFGAVLVLLVILVSSLAPHIAPYEPSALNPSERLLAPSADHLFGTDMFGRDLFSRIVYGAQPTLQVAIGAVLLGLLPGTALGLLAGQRRSLFDQIMTQIVDAWLALPGVLVALVMVAMLGRSLTVLMLALGISSIPTFYRIVRTETMRIYSEESFGPVVSIIRAGSVDEAVRVANDTEYGLSSAVFGKDVTRAMAVARRIESGICHINGPTVHDEAQMPFGGVKASGYGRFGGKAGINEFTELRWITLRGEPRDFPF